MSSILHSITARLVSAIRGKTVKSPLNPQAGVLDDISDRVSACASIVSKTLGSGLPEVIYENALAHEMRKSGLAVSQQQAVAVYYDGMIVGDYTVNLLVEDLVLVDLKTGKIRDRAHTTQCMNYLKATNHAICLLFNFGNPRLRTKRVVSGL